MTFNLINHSSSSEIKKERKKKPKSYLRIKLAKVTSNDYRLRKIEEEENTQLEFRFMLIN